MKTNFILTFDYDQEFLDLDILPLPTKKEMVAFVRGLTTGMFPNRELVKVSMCVYTGDIPMDKVKLPDWYEKCNGKLWKNDLTF